MAVKNKQKAKTKPKPNRLTSLNDVDQQQVKTCPVIWKGASQWSQEHFKQNTKVLQAGEKTQKHSAKQCYSILCTFVSSYYF